jgi:hypothetical protein
VTDGEGAPLNATVIPVTKRLPEIVTVAPCVAFVGLKLVTVGGPDSANDSSPTGADSGASEPPEHATRSHPIEQITTARKTAPILTMDRALTFGACSG